MVHDKQVKKYFAEHELLSMPVEGFDCSDTTLIAKIDNTIEQNCDEDRYLSYDTTKLKDKELVRVQNIHEIPISVCELVLTYTTNRCKSGFLSIQKYSAVHISFL